MGWSHGHPCERPAHVVWVDAFLIARTPVTNGELAAYLAATGAPPAAVLVRSRVSPTRTSPSSVSSWAEAHAFAAWSGRGCRPRRSGARRRAAASTTRATRGATLKPGVTFTSVRPASPADAGQPSSGLTDLSGAVPRVAQRLVRRGHYRRARRRGTRAAPGRTRRVSRRRSGATPIPESVAHRSSPPPHLALLRLRRATRPRRLGDPGPSGRLGDAAREGRRRARRTGAGVVSSLTGPPHELEPSLKLGVGDQLRRSRERGVRCARRRAKTRIDLPARPLRSVTNPKAVCPERVATLLRLSAAAPRRSRGRTERTDRAALPSSRPPNVFR
mgnify:CR=1 FL=1